MREDVVLGDRSEVLAAARVPAGARFEPHACVTEDGSSRDGERG